MENNNTNEEFEDALSLCDFAIESSFDEHPNSPSSQEEDLFEFSTTCSTSTSTSTSSESNSTADHNIIFCGKIIYCKEINDEQRNNKPLLIPASPRMLNKNKNTSSKAANLAPETRISTTSSKKHKSIIIGLTRIPAKMELNDLRERHNRKLQTLTPMFPAAVVDGKPVAVSTRGKSHNWSLLRPFRLRAQDLTRMLAKSSSLGCLRLARPCID